MNTSEKVLKVLSKLTMETDVRFIFWFHELLCNNEMGKLLSVLGLRVKGGRTQRVLAY